VDFIDLIITNPIACIAIVSLSLNVILFKLYLGNSGNIGELKSIIQSKDNEINSLIAERECLAQKKEKTISSFNRESESLSNKIKHLKSSTPQQPYKANIKIDPFNL